MDDEYIVGVASWHNHTTVNPLGLIAVFTLGMILVAIPRRYAITPMLVLASFIPSAQRIIVSGADFDFLRILVLFAWFRLFARKEFQGFVWNRLDTMVIAWKISGTLIYTLAYGGDQSALIYRCGWSFDGFGMYFFFRCMLRDWEDYRFLIYSFALISFPVFLAFSLEHTTGHNVFSMFGGVPDVTVVREGKLRCQGAYSHPILAGCFWVVPMPWMIAQAVNENKLLYGGGIVAAFVVVVYCASSTPVLAFVIMLVGMSIYLVRVFLPIIRWGVLFMLLVLHMIMNEPVWSLLKKIDLVGGSTGAHRYYILDATINHFSNWWILGETNPMGWGIWQMRDITNQFILEALRGGLLTLTCFIVMISISFSYIGRARRSCGEDKSRHLLVWCIGTTMFIHVCIFFAVSYFGQIMLMWYLTLAMIGSLPTLPYGNSEQICGAEEALPRDGRKPAKGAWWHSGTASSGRNLPFRN